MSIPNAHGWEYQTTANIIQHTQSEYVKSIITKNLMKDYAANNPDCLWETPDYAELERIAIIQKCHAATPYEWARIIGMLAAFLIFMCKNENIGGIAISKDSNTVYLSIKDASYARIKEVVNSYTDWRANNPSIPYFDIELTSSLIPADECDEYLMTILPRG